MAVLVLYKTPLHQAATFTSLSESLKKSNVNLDWFVYDNSPLSQHDKTSESGVILRSDPTNPGVSKAYNEGFKMADSLGKKWLLLLDQDTHFPTEALEKYYSALITYPDEHCFIPRLIDQLGIISPFKFRLGNGIRISSVLDGIQHFNKLHFVNSGLMISVSAFRQATGYDEDFPMDFSDYAFIERIRTHHQCFVLVPLSANHSHSSLQESTVNEDLKRFNRFIRASTLFRKKYYPGNLLITLRPFLRAVKLSMRHKTVAFVKQYFESRSHD